MTYSLRSLLKLVLAVAVAVVVYLYYFPVDRIRGYESYNAETFADALKETRPILLTCNAPWTLSARPNYDELLASPAIVRELKKHSFRVIQVDLLREDFTVLTQLPGINGNVIPFAAVYPPTERARPRVVAGHLTEHELIRLLSSAVDPDEFN